ncbi:NUDIX domain-containing protein [Saccharothrix sp. Mg75]|uniref:NUDIX domain-containing protein n=1 Tax=Saccharothrix sp. Mg75 TaxID=3445357 RepID=UPI003EEB02A7
MPRVDVPRTAPARTSGALLPVDRYTAALPRKRTASGMLFRDPDGRVLLVQPSYKPNWEIPGGAGEYDESPWATAARETAEELGLRTPTGRLLVVDWLLPQDGRPEGIVFVFDGGVLRPADVAAIKPGADEILSASFHTMTQVRPKVKPVLADRIVAALRAVEQGTTLLCEHGSPIG